MKRFILFFIFLSFSFVAFCQSENSRIHLIESQIDSLAKVYSVKEISVACEIGFDGRMKSSNFEIHNGFLVLDKKVFFNLNNLIMFRIDKRLWDEANYIEFYFK